MGGSVIGIDLGTANSCVAVVREGRAIVLGEGAKRTIPSVLALHKGKEVVGDAARRQLVTDPHNTVCAVKRLLGHGYESPEVQTVRERVPYPIRPSPLGSVLLEVGGRDLTPVQVSARVLQKIKAVAEEALGEDVTRAVISVPAHFNDVQRKATKLAAEYAGLEVLRLINEPTAAAFAYGYRKGEDFSLAVYDLGGGTFDITVMTARGDCFEVVATDGDSYLGGEDFDHALCDWLAEEFREEFGHELKGDEAALLRVKEAAEHAKIELSERPETIVEIPYLTQLPDGSRPTLNRTLTREKLQEIITPILNRTFELCSRCLEEARVPKAALDEILLVGGQSRMPLVREQVKDFFGKEPRRDINPDEVVAMGAALFAYSLTADDLQEEAEGAADDAFAVALKGADVARRVVREIKEIESSGLDLPELRERIQSLLQQAEDLPAPRGKSATGAPAGDASDDADLPASAPGDADLPASASGDANLPASARGAGRASDLPAKSRPRGRDENLPAARSKERDLPGPSSKRKGSEPAGEDADIFSQRHLPQRVSENPEALDELREEIDDLSAEAQEAIGKLAEEIRSEVEAAPEESQVEAPALEQLSSQLEEKLQTRLESAREHSAEAESLLDEADEHKNARRIDLIDVTSLALGIHAAEDLFTILMEHNTRVPAEHTRVFTTYQDGQSEVHLRVRQGRAPRASQNQLLGEFILTGIRSARRLEPKIEVCFAIDGNGILSVSARDKDSGREQSIRVEDPLGLQQLTVEDLERLEEEAERACEEAAAEAAGS